MLSDDGGENDLSLKALARAVSDCLSHMCLCLELFSSENRGQMAPLVSPLQIRRIVTADTANRRVEAHRMGWLGVGGSKHDGISSIRPKRFAFVGRRKP